MATILENEIIAAADFPLELISTAGQIPRPRLDPLRAIRGLWTHRGLVWQLAWRKLRQRYQGSVLGLGWSFLIPLLHLAVYTFVFNVVLRGRWGQDPQESRLEFALTLFCGLVFYSIFSETVAAAPLLVVQNAAYVKKTIFPLETLPVISLVQVLLRAGVSFLVLLAAVLVLTARIHWTMLLAPLPVIPLLLLALGISWFLAALGVFLRDMSHAVTILLQLTFFLTPIVYPLAAVPGKFRVLLQLNPLTHIVEMARGTVLWGRLPDWGWYAAVLGGSLLVFQGGFMFFMRSKRAFADVL